ncbi:hypothetical protein D3C80_1589860 [compost metagenome]
MQLRKAVSDKDFEIFLNPHSFLIDSSSNQTIDDGHTVHALRIGQADTLERRCLGALLGIRTHHGKTIPIEALQRLFQRFALNSHGADQVGMVLKELQAQAERIQRIAHLFQCRLRCQ